MKTERWGNDADGQFQGLTTSRLLPQLSQDAFFSGGWYPEPLQKRMPDLQVSPVVLRLALRGGGAGGLRRDFGFSRRHSPNEKELNRADLTTKLAQQVQQD
jgi:hypothetical protein